MIAIKRDWKFTMNNTQIQWVIHSLLNIDRNNFSLSIRHSRCLWPQIIWRHSLNIHIYGLWPFRSLYMGGCQNRNFKCLYTQLLIWRVAGAGPWVIVGFSLDSFLYYLSFFAYERTRRNKNSISYRILSDILWSREETVICVVKKCFFMMVSKYWLTNRTLTSLLCLKCCEL